MNYSNCTFKTVIFVILCIFLSSENFAQSTSQKPIPKDWFEKDPISDSLAGISLDKAYLLLKGRNSKIVIVAVIDNGVDILHEDLKNVIWTNKKEIPGNSIDDDGNGYVDDVHGWNFRGAKDGTIIENEQAGATQFYLAWKNKFENADTNLLKTEEKKKFAIYTKAKKEYEEKLNGKDSSDIGFAYNINYHSDELIENDSASSGRKFYGSPHIKLSSNLTHGTHVAGIIAAQRNNDKGIDGIADNVLIMPIVASTAVGDERDKDVANAIRYAVDNGAKIINMSFSKLYSSDKKMVDEAIRYAENKDVLIVHAAGNDGVDIDSAKNYHYPIAMYDDGNKARNFITVGWNRPLFDYRLAHPNSDYGKMNVDLFAPGSDIFSTVPNNGYDFKSGSSMSTPVVSGVAALLFSYFPSLSASRVKEILVRSVYKPDQLVNRPQTKIQVSFNSLSVSGGIVNAYNAVKMAIELTKK
jgi:subtilisin family serine protease